MRKKHTSHVKALKYLRTEHYGETLSYQEVADILSNTCGETIPKSEPWNAEHRKYKCPPRVKKALIDMGLLGSGRRYRFFYEVSPEKYDEIQKWLREEGVTFTEYMRHEDEPWAE